MNIAVLLYGEVREFEKAVISYDVFKNLNTDFFISTWSKTIDYDENENEFYRYVDKNEIIKKLSKCEILIYNQDKYTHLDGTQKMIFHWKELSKILNKTNKRYDSVILMRIDNYLLYLNEEILSTENEENTVYIQHGLRLVNNKPYIDDWIQVGNQKSIIEFIDIMPIYPALPSHYGPGEVIQQSKFKIKNLESIHVNIMRPNMRKYITSDLEKNLEFLSNNWLKFQQDWGTYEDRNREWKIF